MQFLGNAEKVWVDKFCVKICFTFAFKVPDLVWHNYIAAKYWPCVIVSSFCLIAVIILHVLVDWLCVYACLFCSPSGGAQQMQGLLIDVKCRELYQMSMHPIQNSKTFRALFV